MICAHQIRAARSLIGWSRSDLSAASGVSMRTLDRAENPDGNPSRKVLQAIESAFAAAGVRFIDNGVQRQ